MGASAQPRAARLSRVFQLAQIIGWTPEELFKLGRAEWAALLDEIQEFASIERRRVFHAACERRFYTWALDAPSLHAQTVRDDPVSPRFQAMFCATMLALRGWVGIAKFLGDRSDQATRPIPEGRLVKFLALKLTLDRLARAWVGRIQCRRHPIALDRTVKSRLLLSRRLRIPLRHRRLLSSPHGLPRLQFGLHSRWTTLIKDKGSADADRTRQQHDPQNDSQSPARSVSCIPAQIVWHCIPFEVSGVCVRLSVGTRRRNSRTP